jgi:hypothetical protein
MENTVIMKLTKNFNFLYEIEALKNNLIIKSIIENLEYIEGFLSKKDMTNVEKSDVIEKGRKILELIFDFLDLPKGKTIEREKELFYRKNFYLNSEKKFFSNNLTNEES